MGGLDGSECSERVNKLLTVSAYFEDLKRKEPVEVPCICADSERMRVPYSLTVSETYKYQSSYVSRLWTIIGNEVLQD